MNLNEYSQTVLRNECILHTKAVNAKGYGVVTYHGPNTKRLTALAHRVAYARYHKIPLEDLNGMLVLHMCDVPNCVNPEHLYLGTHQDNVNDMYQKGRNKVSNASRNQGESCGTSKYTEETVRQIRAEARLGVRLLSEKYGLPRTTISSIVHRHTWKHI